MASQGLQNYIAQSRAAGMTDEQIRQELLRSGWDEASVSVAMGGVAAPAQPAEPTSSAAPAAVAGGGRKGLWIILAVIAGLALLAGVGFAMGLFGKDSKEKPLSVSEEQTTQPSSNAVEEMFEFSPGVTEIILPSTFTYEDRNSTGRLNFVDFKKKTYDGRLPNISKTAFEEFGVKLTETIVEYSGQNAYHAKSRFSPGASGWYTFSPKFASSVEELTFGPVMCLGVEGIERGGPGEIKEWTVADVDETPTGISLGCAHEAVGFQPAPPFFYDLLIYDSGENLGIETISTPAGTFKAQKWQVEYEHKLGGTYFGFETGTIWAIKASPATIPFPVKIEYSSPSNPEVTPVIWTLTALGSNN